MATTSNLSSIIRYYAEKQNSPFIDLREFCTYVKKYAEHHVEDQAELVKYLGDPTATVEAELQGLQEKHLAAVIPNGNKKLIISIPYFSAKFANQYKEITRNESLPYPLEPDLPKKLPQNFVERKKLSLYLNSIIEEQNLKSPALYVIDFERDLPSIVMPACVPLQTILETAQLKIRKIMKKEEFHDYFLKKLRGSNPSKEISLKHFFTHYIDQATTAYMDVSEGDDYYLWNQLCYYIRQDFEKIQDRTVEDINVLQAIQITEVHSTYLKEKFQDNRKREEALKELDSNLKKPPYFYSHDQIVKFRDNNGHLLCEQYSNDDLNQYMQTKTTAGKDSELAEMLFFKVSSGTRYYIFKKNIYPLVVRLCNEAHESVRSKIVKDWNASLLEYEKLPEMNDNAKFEKLLENTVEETSPILHGLLTASFIPLLAFEKIENNDSSFTLFLDHKLVPYSELLMIKRDKVLADAKLALPFIYSIPLISWILALIHTKKKNKKKKEKIVEEVKNPFEEEESTKKTPRSKEQALAEKAIELSRELIPEGSTIDRELNYLVKQWNQMLTKELNLQLTEDVNALIRDYTRKVCRTLSVQSFTRDRIQNLADALVRTPNLQKIRDQKALTEYVQLYMIRLVSNSAKN
ncbi:MAG: hypothetical protein MJ162_00060 [Treponema sp.]|nr:hypothetical protein [Treponema sp.]